MFIRLEHILPPSHPLGGAGYTANVYAVDENSIRLIDDIVLHLHLHGFATLVVDQVDVIGVIDSDHDVIIRLVVEDNSKVVDVACAISCGYHGRCSFRPIWWTLLHPHESAGRKITCA